jgi:hypothetical protein
MIFYSSIILTTINELASTPSSLKPKGINELIITNEAIEAKYIDLSLEDK